MTYRTFIAAAALATTLVFSGAAHAQFTMVDIPNVTFVSDNDTAQERGKVKLKARK